jgi:hypothetical protein
MGLDRRERTLRQEKECVRICEGTWGVAIPPADISKSQMCPLVSGQILRSLYVPSYHLSICLPLNSKSHDKQATFVLVRLIALLSTW